MQQALVLAGAGKDSDLEEDDEEEGDLEQEGTSSTQRTGNDLEHIEIVALVPDPDVYESVVVAAFGGVDMHLQNDLPSVKVHPIFLWVASMISALCQAILILAVILEVDQRQFILNHGYDNFTKPNMKTSVKLVLIVIVQVMLLREIRHALETVMFVINPRTWARRLEPDFEGRLAWMFTNRHGSPIFAALAIIASLAKFAIANAISKLSLTIIFIAESLTDAIFNSLALTFIIDLDEAFWKVLELNFNIRVREDFGYKQRVEDDCTRHPSRWGRGWSALNSRRTVVSVVLFIFYCRQLMSILTLMEWHVLPTTFQLCMMWSYLHEEADTACLLGWLHAAMNTLLGPIDEQLFVIATGNVKGIYVKENCSSRPHGHTGSIHHAANETVHRNYIDYMMSHNSSGVCHCEALEGFWTLAFWQSHVIPLFESHTVLTVVGFSCAFTFVLLPVLLDFFVQMHEEKTQMLAPRGSSLKRS